MNYQMRKAKFLTNQKRRTVLNLISSFAITIVAVVAVVSLTAHIPKATLFEIIPYGNEIYYHIEVIDSDHQIVDGSLNLVVSNQIEQYTVALELGEQSGSITSLHGGRTYQVDLMCDYGYGAGVLASSTIQTNTSYGGRITRWRESSPDMYQEMSTLQIDLAFSDPTSELEEVWLKYVYFPSGAYPVENVLPTNTEYTTYFMTSLHDQCLIEGLWEGQLRFFTYLEARTIDGDVVLLDSLIFTTPLKLFTSLYVEDIDTTQVQISFYADFDVNQDIEYQLLLIKESKVIQTKTYHYEDFSGEEMYLEILFTGLTPQTKYYLQLLAVYQDNDDLITLPLQSMDISLINDYDIDVTIQDLGQLVEVQVSLQDPNQVLSELYYYVYEVVEGNELYVTGGEVILVMGEDQLFHGLFNLPKDPTKQYQLYIYGTKAAFDGTIYPWTTIYQVNY